jgi:uncharacterized protein YbcC (UPF0753/DUF2309 family)
MVDSGQWQDILNNVRRLLPIQNPLQTFLHNNMLMAFEEEPFWDGVQKAAHLYGARTTRPLAFYFNEYKRGRIQDWDLKLTLTHHLGRPPTESELAQLFEKPPILLPQGPKPPQLLSQSMVGWTAHFLEHVLDQGLAITKNPFAKRNLLDQVRIWLKSSLMYEFEWQKKLAFRIDECQASPGEFIRKTLGELPEDGREPLVLELLFTLKGWAGMVQKNEKEPDRMPFFQSHICLEEMIALLLLLADIHTDQTIPFLPKARVPIHRALIIWQEAYEEALYQDVFHSLPKLHGPLVPKLPSFQLFCCMDDRMESFRRHLEDQDPSCETLGILGHFNLDMQFVSPGHPRPSQQCPPVVQPRKTLIEERVQDTPGNSEEEKRSSLIQYLKSRHFYTSRTLLGGFIACLTIGSFAFLYSLLKIVLPKKTILLRGWFRSFIEPKSRTRIPLTPEHHSHYGPCGYDLMEQAQMVKAFLLPTGVSWDFPPVVILLAHTSTSANNPYQQAYGCGACSGNSGGVNARVFAKMINNPGVRAILEKEDLKIPPTTLFVPGLYDTALDEIEFLDLKELEWSREQKNILTHIKKVTSKALMLNAQERTRVFANTSQPKTPEEAITHVQERALSLAEPRPEYGHSRVFLAIFGPRALTAGLNLDRRSFLVSYDGRQDLAGEHIKNLLHSAMSVVGNIVLDYFFPSMDPQKFGAGSKLPLNISGLLGVISGSGGDLRVGLAAQMVEIHEPIRPLVLVAGEKKHIEQAINTHSRLKRMVQNDWIRIGVIGQEWISLWKKGQIWEDVPRDTPRFDPRFHTYFPGWEAL